VFRWVVAELNAMAKPGHRQPVHAAARFGGLDDGRHVVGVAVDRNTPFDNRKGQSLGLQIAIVDANQRGKLSAGGGPMTRSRLGSPP
jgi:hypothetical protein